MPIADTNLIINIITIIAFLIQLGYLIFAFGRLSNKVDNNAARIDKIEKKLDNGFTCKSHAELMRYLGVIQGIVKSYEENVRKIK